MTLPTDALDFDLPPELIATRPVEPRDSARLMHLSRIDGEVAHRRFHDLPELLRAGDLLVLNDTRVLPARLRGRRVPGGGRVGGLFLEEREAGRWLVMLRVNGRLHAADVVELIDQDEEPVARLSLVERQGDGWLVDVDPPSPAAEILGRAGQTPLPPYILGARRDRSEAVDDSDDHDWYQTVFAGSHAGSVAAPTAGLHMTEDLLQRLADQGVRTAQVTLDVGAGTFKPVSTDTVEAHDMHEERYEVTPETLRAVRETRAAGGRVIAVGTTSVRTLESIDDLDADEPVSGSTRLLITPGYTFRHVDGMVTNFHLPRSTLLALVAALAGLDETLAAYRVAIAERYRFYSYGDAMLIV